MSADTGGRAIHYRWEDLPREAINPLIGRRLISTDRMMIAHIYLKKGCVVPRHAHENEQITYVLEGALRFHLGATGADQAYLFLLAPAAASTPVFFISILCIGKLLPLREAREPGMELKQQLTRGTRSSLFT